VAAVELGLMLPMLMVLLATVVELAHFMATGEAVEKGMRAAAMYAARADLPLSATVKTNVETLVQRGSLSTSDPYLTNAWSSGGTVNVATTTGTANGTSVDVIKVTAAVTYSELMPGVLDFLGLGPLTISLEHEQAYVGS
jgi:Flp pilus assembly protein TadG